MEDDGRRQSCRWLTEQIGQELRDRTVRLFEEAGILERHEFGDGRARYEQVASEHHDHLIDMRSGEVIEFRNDQVERLQEAIARQLGYKLIDHRLELYGVPLKGDEKG